MSGTVVPLQQSVDEAAPCGLKQRVRVSQFDQPVPVAPASQRTGTVTQLMKR